MSELDPGDRRIVDIDGVEVGVFNVDGEYHALLNRCVHQYGPVCEGNVMPIIEAEHTGSGEHVSETLSADDHMVVCPWHGWSFDLRTGTHTGDETIRLPTYDVVVDGDVVFVEY